MVLFGLMPGLNLNAAQQYSAVPGKSSGMYYLMSWVLCMKDTFPVAEIGIWPF